MLERDCEVYTMIVSPEGIRKLGIASGGVAAMLTLALKARPDVSYLPYLVCITLVTVYALSWQGTLDYFRDKMKKKEDKA